MIIRFFCSINLIRMKMKNTIFYLFPLYVFFAGCNNRNDYKFSEQQIKSLEIEQSKVLTVEKAEIEHIDLNSFLKKQSFDLTDKIDEMKFISLETTDESLVSAIYNIIVSESYFYIHDNFKGGGLVIFDKKGKFVKRIKNGRGPGELRKLTDICYDEKSQKLVVYQYPFISFYTPRGDFINHQRLPFGFYNFLIQGDNYIFKTLDRFGNEHLQDKCNNTLLITNSNFKLEGVSLPFNPKKISYSGYNYLRKSIDGFVIAHSFIDTLYCLDSECKNIKAKYLLDFKDKKIPDSYLELDFAEARGNLSKNDFYYFLGKYMETRSHQVFFLHNNYINLNTVIYRDKSTGKLIGGTSLNYNEKELLPYGFPLNSTSDYFMSLYWPDGSEKNIVNSPFISDAEIHTLKSVKNGDNPIIILFGLKGF